MTRPAECDAPRSKRLAIVKSIAAFALTVVCLGLSACGSPKSSAAGAPGAGIVAGPGPITAEIDIDGSGSNASPAVRTQYVDAALRAAELWFARGGTVKVRLFSGTSHGVTLLDSTLPSADTLSGVQRARQVVPLRGALREVLEEALGLKRVRNMTLARALDALAPGTDVAGNVADSLSAVAGRPNPLVVVVSDGEDNRFRAVTERSSVLAHRISRFLPRARGVTLVMVGIGASRGGGLSTARTQTLQRTWTRACEHTGARCFISPDIDFNLG